MSLAVLRSRALTGIAAPPVRVETHLANGLPAFTIVGLADTGVRESRERVRAAILNSGYEFPNRRITVNLAPADLPKESTLRPGDRAGHPGRQRPDSLRSARRP